MEAENTHKEAAENPDTTIAPTGDAQGVAKTTAPPDISAEAHNIAKKSKRTPGLRLFDLLLYPLLNNISVFALSVGATYLTTKGGTKDASGKLIYGKFGEFFQKRGDWLATKFQSLGMNKESADMSKMVFFSFADGSLVAPLIKLLEDRRETIAQNIDNALGTTPKDLSVYESEPKQSWLSVLGGRFATAAIVVPTAYTLDKLHVTHTNPKTHTKEFVTLNDKFFNNNGVKLGEKIKEKGWLKNFSAKHDTSEIARVSIFEAFYTSVCTAGLYFSSRFFARTLDKPENHKPKKHSSPDATYTTRAAPAPVEPEPTATPKKPETRVAHINYADRLDSMPTPALGA